MSNEGCYTFGNCTWYVAQQLPWVPCGLHDSGDWVQNALRAGFYVTSVPTSGAVVCYGPSPSYSAYGHVAIVEQVYSRSSFSVREMNYVGFNEVDHRVSGLGDVTGFILAPGLAAGSGMPAAAPAVGGALDDVRLEWAALAGYLNTGVDSQLWRLRSALTGLAQLAP